LIPVVLYLRYIQFFGKLPCLGFLGMIGLVETKQI